MYKLWYDHIMEYYAALKMKNLLMWKQYAYIFNVQQSKITQALKNINLCKVQK